MRSKNESFRLNEAIEMLQVKKAGEWIILKEQFSSTYENLRPLNLIKNTFHDVTSSPDIKNNLLNGAIGLTTGFLSKKILIGSSHNPVKKLLGTFLEFAIANVVVKYFSTNKAEELKKVHDTEVI